MLCPFARSLEGFGNAETDTPSDAEVLMLSVPPVPAVETSWTVMTLPPAAQAFTDTLAVFSAVPVVPEAKMIELDTVLLEHELKLSTLVPLK